MNIINAYFIRVCVCVCFQTACDTRERTNEKNVAPTRNKYKQFKGDSLNVIKFVHELFRNLQADAMQSQ